MNTVCAASAPDLNPYAAAGVDTEAGDRAVELMKASVSATHTPNVFGGFGGFAGLWDASDLKSYDKPLLATSTDGVGTKVAIAQALDKHDTIGYDLVGMVVDDIVVVGAKPLFMTDYIACGKVVPERIAAIVTGIAKACAEAGTALVGGETAEHPGLLGEDDYDVAGACTGVVEADNMLGAERVREGDVVLALASSGLHSNGFSLVRHILAQAGVAYTDQSDALGTTWGEALLVPTRVYAQPLLDTIDEHPGAIHALSHVTGGGLAANLARVLPQGTSVEVDRATWQPPTVFRALAELSGTAIEDTESTWNLGVGFFAIVAADQAGAVQQTLTEKGIETWPVGVVREGVAPFLRRNSPEAADSGQHAAGAADSSGEMAADGWTQGAKGVDGGAVRLVGSYKGNA